MNNMTKAEESVAGLVIDELGRPPDYWMTRAKQIPNKDNFRVDIWIKFMPPHCQIEDVNIVDSFWVTCKDGEITDSNPPLEFKYEQHIKKGMLYEDSKVACCAEEK